MEEARPPYVKFEARAVEDREASIEKGHYVAKDVVFVLVTPAGTKDVVEKVAEEWLESLRQAAQAERIPATWPQMYKEAYDLWLKNQEDPEFGTPIKAWPMVSPSQVANIVGANILTVEDLAEATEEALGRIGMGAQALKSKAQAWLESSGSTGVKASELNALRTQVADLKTQNESQAKKITEQAAELKKLRATEKA